MKSHKHIIALSITAAFMLSGCDGGDDNSTNVAPPSTGGSTAGGSIPDEGIQLTGAISITAMDGYLKNAYVCADTDKDGACTGSDTYLGMTTKTGQVADKNGKVGDESQFSAEQIKAAKDYSIVVRALLPNTDYSNLSVEAGIYTIDMDHPWQAMDKDVSFRAPAGSAVITPITDLIVAEMKKGADKATAEKNIQQDLAVLLGSNANEFIDLYSNYIKEKEDIAPDSDQLLVAQKLHKTAQILTESQANVDKKEDFDQVLEQVVAKAVETVDQVSPEDLENPDYKPFITVTVDEAGEVSVEDEVKVNYTAKVDSAVHADFVSELDNADFKTDESIDFTSSTSLDGLFIDKDHSDPLAVKVDNSQSLSEAGFDVTITNNQLVIEHQVNDNDKSLAGSYFIELSADDFNDAEERVGTVKTVIEFKVEAFSTAPEVVNTVKNTIQAQLDELVLQASEEIALVTLDSPIVDLFNDIDGDTLTITSSPAVNGLKITINGDLLELSGTPAVAGSNFTFSITATDGETQVKADFTLPEVAAAPITENPLSELLVEKALYRFNADWVDMSNEPGLATGSEHHHARPDCWAVMLNSDNTVSYAEGVRDNCPAEADFTISKTDTWAIEDESDIKLHIDGESDEILSLRANNSNDRKMPSVALWTKQQTIVVESSATGAVTASANTEIGGITFFVGRESAQNYWAQNQANVVVNGKAVEVDANSKTGASNKDENEVLDADLFFNTNCENLGFKTDGKGGYRWTENVPYEFYLLNSKLEHEAFQAVSHEVNSFAFGNNDGSECAVDFDYQGSGQFIAGESVVVYADPRKGFSAEEFTINTFTDRNDTIEPAASLNIDANGIYIPIQEELAVERWYRDAEGKIRAELLDYVPLTQGWATASRNDVVFTEYDVNGHKLVQVWESETQSGQTEYDSFTAWTDGEQTIKDLNVGAEGTPESYSYVTSLEEAKKELLDTLNSNDKIINAADGTPFAVYNPVTFTVKAADGNTVIGIYDPLSGEVFDAAGQLVYRYTVGTGVITDANGKEVGTLNEDGTISSPSDPDDSNEGNEGDAVIMTPEQFKLHGNVLETETITVQSGSGPTVVTINSSVTVSGQLTIKD